MANDDHHDNRYEDGDEATGTVEDYDSEWLSPSEMSERDRRLGALLAQIMRRHEGGTWVFRKRRKADSTERP